MITEQRRREKGRLRLGAGRALRRCQPDCGTEAALVAEGWTDEREAKQRLVLFILPCWVKAFPMARAFLFTAVCSSAVGLFIKEPGDEGDADDDDVVVLDAGAHQA